MKKLRKMRRRYPFAPGSFSASGFTSARGKRFFTANDVGCGLSFRTLDTRSVDDGLDTLIVPGQNRITLEGLEERNLRASMFDFI